MKRLQTGWRAAALLTFNLLLLLAGANLLAWALLAVLPDPDRPSLDAELLRQAYPGRSDREIQQIQQETWGRDYLYEAFTQFKEGPVAGEFVTVDETGFRRSPEAHPWPPDPSALNIFVFGGSTSFGYGVADAETLPASLERHLHAAGCESARVYNLGRSNYFSTQERILFEQLVLDGHAPSAALFIDGLNEFFAPEGYPKFTRRLDYLMAESPPQVVLRSLKLMPLARLARRLVGSGGSGPEDSEADIDNQATAILDRWQANGELIRATAGSRGIATLFAWQPVPVFGIHSGLNPFLSEASEALPNAELLERGYELQAQRAHHQSFLWLANLAPRSSTPAYVDRAHYSAAFTSELAGAIATDLKKVACLHLESRPHAGSDAE